MVGDGTQIITDEGRLHLVSVLDVASRRVLGFALGERHDAALAYGALAMASAVRGDLAAVAAALNGRPRKTLCWKTPAEALDEFL
jgi:hypothetical protein